MNSRYQFSSKSILPLSDNQRKAKAKVAQKVDSGEYEFEEVGCIICNGTNRHKLSERDRYGLQYHVSACKTCGLVQTNPRMTQDAYSAFYSDHYRDLYNDGAKELSAFFSSQYRKAGAIAVFLRAQAFDLKGASILSVGCGAGGVLQYLKDRGAKVTGVDLNVAYLKFGREKGLDLREGFITEIPEGEKFDLIIYNHVMEHVLEPIQELAEVCKRLRPNGAVYIEVPGIKNLKSYHFDFLRYLQNAHVYHFSAKTLSNVLNIAGFEVISVDESVRLFARFKKKHDNAAVVTSDLDDSLKYLQEAEKKRLSVGLLIKLKSNILSFVVKVLDAFGIRKLYKSRP